MTFEQIAALLGISKGQAFFAYKTALKKLEILLKDKK